MNFKQTVQKMSATEIMLAMVEGLENPTTKIKMITFGTCDREKGVCYGCAATNTITQISGRAFPPEKIDMRLSRANFLKVDLGFMSSFENAINALRQGAISTYNEYARVYGFAEIKDTFDIENYFFYLDDDYEQWQLDAWRFIAYSQEK